MSHWIRSNLVIEECYASNFDILFVTLTKQTQATLRTSISSSTALSFVQNFLVTKNKEIILSFTHISIVEFCRTINYLLYFFLIILSELILHAALTSFDNDNHNQYTLFVFQEWGRREVTQL